MNAFIGGKNLFSKSEEAITWSLKNVIDLVDSVCEFMFFSRGESHSFSIQKDPDMQVPDILLSGVCVDLIQKVILRHFQSDHNSPRASEKEKLKESFDQYLDLFKCIDRFFEELQRQASSIGGVDIASIQPLFSQLASKLARLYSRESYFSFLTDKRKKLTLKEKDLEESIRLFTVFILQNGSPKSKRGYGTVGRRASPFGPSGGSSDSLKNMFSTPSEGMFQEQRSDLSTKKMLAHNIVRMKLGQRALVPRSLSPDSVDSKE
jgi:hypothetical protein